LIHFIFYYNHEKIDEINTTQYQHLKTMLIEAKTSINIHLDNLQSERVVCLNLRNCLQTVHTENTTLTTILHIVYHHYVYTTSLIIPVTHYDDIVTRNKCLKFLVLLSSTKNNNYWYWHDLKNKTTHHYHRKTYSKI
jgi:hypothetical protein